MSLVVRAVVVPYNGSGSGIAGAISLHGWNGWIPSLQGQTDEWQRLGQIGSGAQVLGKRGKKVNCKGWQGFSSQADAVAAVSAWEALESATVYITDGFSRKLPHVRLTNVSATPIKTKGPVISGTEQVLFRVECSADCERLPDS